MTLPPTERGGAALAFAEMAKAKGADLLEVRSDLHDASERLAPLAKVLPLVVSLRDRPLAEEWQRAATFVDIPVELPWPSGCTLLLSHHATAPLPVEAAVALWRARPIPDGASIKHVEPVLTPEDGVRLLATQRALSAAYPGRVTVLGMGDLALPFRCLLSERNQLDYLKVSDDFAAAPGQRFLADAVRSGNASGPRRGILGHRIAHSLSPRIHRQPFDRLELPKDAPLGALVDALRPYYAGFSVTSPFKQVLARHVGFPGALNTLARSAEGPWKAANTDVAGALAVLDRLGGRRVTVLGDGGVTVALRTAAAERGIELEVLRRASPKTALAQAVVWTWPDGVLPPDWLTFHGATVAVIAYGRAAKRIAEEVRRRGGTPALLGPRWFVAQARAQRELWGHVP